MTYLTGPAASLQDYQAQVQPNGLVRAWILTEDGNLLVVEENTTMSTSVQLSDAFLKSCAGADPPVDLQVNTSQ